MLKGFFKVIVISCLIICGVFAGSAYLTVIKWHSPSDVELTIPKGVSVKHISQILKKRKVIGAEGVFRIYIAIKGVASDLKAGSYDFPAGTNMVSVVKKLVRGDVTKHSITIIEGWTIKDIAKLLSKKDYLSNSDMPQKFIELAHNRQFMDVLEFEGIPSLEGYLFPDTYNVEYPLNADEFLKRLVKHFRDVWSDIAKGHDLHGMTMNQIVTLASIIEKETSRSDERAIIAGVMINRLNRGIPLQSDPTIIYGLPNFNGNLTRRDIRNPHPYNTYVHKGLPPGPICNPGRASLAAAISPAKTDFMYFVSKNDGSHYFSKTLVEHLRAVRRYQIIGRGSKNEN